MQTSWLPQFTCDRIDRLTREFVWKGTQGKGINLVGWDKITLGKSNGGLAIRTARDANTAMLGKLVWDIHSQTNKLWVHLVRHKYMGNLSILKVAKKNGSYTWNSIIKARNILEAGYGFRVGNGLSSLWYSDWTSYGPLAKVVPFIDIHDSQLSIADIYFDHSWHLELLYSFLPTHIIDHIRNLRLDLNPAVDDRYIWRGNLDGVYTAKAGYQWLLSLKNPVHYPNDSQSWRWIWNIQGPEKIKFLIWLACHNALQTTSLLHHRGMMTDPNCQRCGYQDESVLHCLRDCPETKALWKTLGFCSNSFFQQHNTFDWIKDAIQGPTSHLFLASLWWLWRARNSLCISQEPIPVHVLRLSIESLASLILDAFAKEATPPRPPRLVSWKPSPAHDVVLNVDGSSLGNPGTSGFGGLLRGNDGNWVAGFIGNIGISTNLHAELLGLQHGLEFAWNKGFRSLICYSDSMNVIQLVSSPLNKWNLYAPIVQTIIDLLARDWVVMLTHTLREGNACADFLAKLGAAGVSPFATLEDPPIGLTSHLIADAAGVTFERL